MYKVLHTTDKEWDNYLQKLPSSKQDVYYTSAYYRTCEENGDGLAEMFIYEVGENLIIYPYLINEIKGYPLDMKYYDIETCYGYGGPIGNSNDDNIYIKFREVFKAYCKEKNIVCEFIRFHPLINNAMIKWQDIEVVHNRSTVTVDLTKSEEEIWKQEISSKNRNMIRKAIKNNLCVEVASNRETFIDIYKQTMSKVRAVDYYFFSDAYYDEIYKVPHVQLNIKKEDIIIASAIFMQYKEYLHYHLSGSRQEYLRYAPNSLLLWEAIKYGKQQGMKAFHLGGGLSDSLQDPLFKFKKEFSNNLTSFYIGKCILNKKVYNKLITEWERHHSQSSRLFLQYKY